MQLNKKAHLTFVSGIVIFLSCSTLVAAVLSPEEIAETIASQDASRFCGQRLNEAMKFLCTPGMKAMIQVQEAHLPVKKSMKTVADLDFENFNLDQIAGENYDDDTSHSRSSFDDSYFLNDVAFWNSPLGNLRRRRGVVDECCKKSCHKIEFIRYCPPPKTVRNIQRK